MSLIPHRTSPVVSNIKFLQKKANMHPVKMLLLKQKPERMTPQLGNLVCFWHTRIRSVNFLSKTNLHKSKVIQTKPNKNNAINLLLLIFVMKC